MNSNMTAFQQEKKHVVKKRDYAVEGQGEGF